MRKYGSEEEFNQKARGHTRSPARGGADPVSPIPRINKDTTVIPSSHPTMNNSHLVPAATPWLFCLPDVRIRLLFVVPQAGPVSLLCILAPFSTGRPSSLQHHPLVMGLKCVWWSSALTYYDAALFCGSTVLLLCVLLDLLIVIVFLFSVSFFFVLCF